jgi:hypothetical protein
MAAVRVTLIEVLNPFRAQQRIHISRIFHSTASIRATLSSSQKNSRVPEVVRAVDTITEMAAGRAAAEMAPAGVGARG